MSADNKRVNLLVYQSNVIDTYLYFILENLNLIKDIYEDYNNKGLALSDWRDKFYSKRAKHLQMMTLIGLTAEHLIKLILLKRGYVLNTSKTESKFKESFMKFLNAKQGKKLSKDELNLIYEKSEKCVEITFKEKLEDFSECISRFNKSNQDDYYDGLGTYIITHPNGCKDEKYFKKEEIEPKETLQVIQKMRNSYIHLAEAKAETRGVVWYLFDFLIWLSKKEYPDFFSDIEYIGNDDIKRLFQK